MVTNIDNTLDGLTEFLAQHCQPIDPHEPPELRDLEGKPLKRFQISSQIEIPNDLNHSRDHPNQLHISHCIPYQTSK